MGKNISVSKLLKKQYKTFELSPEWLEAIGPVEQNFKMIVWGPSGSGKTTYVIKLVKELSKFGKVYYNSTEQGEGKSLQDVVNQCRLDECKPGTIIFGSKDTFDEMRKKLKRNRARFVVIDSLQYMNLTKEQYKQLEKEFPRKSFIIISWEGSGSDPKGEHGKSIRYMACVKVYVKNGKADASSRFGLTKPYKIFDKKPSSGTQHQLELQ